MKYKIWFENNNDLDTFMKDFNDGYKPLAFVTPCQFIFDFDNMVVTTGNRDCDKEITLLEAHIILNMYKRKHKINKINKK